MNSKLRKDLIRAGMRNPQYEFVSNAQFSEVARQNSARVGGLVPYSCNPCSPLVHVRGARSEHILCRLRGSLSSLIAVKIAVEATGNRTEMCLARVHLQIQ